MRGLGRIAMRLPIDAMPDSTGIDINANFGKPAAEQSVAAGRSFQSRLFVGSISGPGHVELSRTTMMADRSAVLQSLECVELLSYNMRYI